MKQDRVKVLFTGNSHTYVNDLPNFVSESLAKKGIGCDSVMLAHGGHASPRGTAYAAEIISDTIYRHIMKKEEK